MTPVQKQILIGAIVAVCSYLIGNINNAVIISKLKGRDIRKSGSGNPGTMNMLRTFGIGIGLFNLALDVAKGVAPCILGWLFMGVDEFCVLGADRLGLYIAGLCVTLGHVFPAVMKFKGGKGVATILGVCITMQPLWTVGFFLAGVVFLIVAKVGSLTSFIMMCASLTVEGVCAAASGSAAIAKTGLLFALFVLTLFAHRSNLVKLFSGKERQVVLFKPKHPKPYVYDDTASFSVDIAE